ncbi:MAG: CvpA family protein [Bacteroidia bacterium]
MNILDILVLLPVGLLMVRGFSKGILAEIFSLIALIAGVIGSLKLAHEFVNLMPVSWQDSNMFKLLLYLAVFAAIFIAVIFLGKAIEGALKVMQLNIFNRIFGLLLGLVKALFIVGLLFWLFALADLVPAETRNGSTLYPLLEDFSPWLIDSITANLPHFQDMVKEIEQSFSGHFHFELS